MLLRRTTGLVGLGSFHRQRALLEFEREIEQWLALLGRKAVSQHPAAVRLEAQFVRTFHAVAV